MPAPFKTIGILGRVKNPKVLDTLKTVIHYLLSLHQVVIVDAEAAAALNDATLTYAARETLCQQVDLLIIVGGDGSLLDAAHVAVAHETPVIGINRGRLGFLTDILPTELNKIKAILDGEYLLEKRFLLNATVEFQGDLLGESDALNEIALIPDSIPHMNEFEIYIDDRFAFSQVSDGVIIATPTGSTAYALSGGGPILHPHLDAMVIVPMFPHTLSIRPIVIEGNHRITMIISPRNTATPRLSCDGQAFIRTPPGSRITLQKKAERLHLIHPIDYDYYETLRSKLHWGRKLHYSET